MYQMQANRNTRLKRILEETKEEDGEAEVRERMQMLSSQLIDSISNLHGVLTSWIFIATCRGFWDRMGQVKRILVYTPGLLNFFSNLMHFLFHLFVLDCSEISRRQEGKSSMV